MIMISRPVSVPELFIKAVFDIGHFSERSLQTSLLSDES